MLAMGLVRAAGRMLLAPLFIIAGIDVLRDPQPRAELAAPLLERVRGYVPALPRDDVLLVRSTATVHLVGGTLMAIGILPRLAAGALAASLVPVTVAGHPFWEVEDPARRAQQRTHLLKNVSIAGGLLVLMAQPRQPDRSADSG